jgi:tetratricopeptide (TPR) repeat protein
MKYSFDKSLRLSKKYNRKIDYYSERASIEKYNAAQDSLLAQPPNYKEAINLFHEVLLLEPDNFEAERSMAFCYDEIDSLGTATSILEQLVTERPGDLPSLNRLAGCYYRQHLYKKCIVTCDTILAIQPRHQNALMMRALALDELGNTTKAISAYERALSVLTNKELIYNLGVCYFSDERYQDAINTLNRLYAIDHADAEVPYLLGECYFELSDYEVAANYFKEAHQVDPSYGDSEKFLKVIDEILER